MKVLILLLGLSVGALWTLKILKAIREKEESMDPYQEDVEKQRRTLR